MNKNVSIRLKRVITRNLLLVVIGIIGLLFSGNIGLHMIASAATQSEREKNDSYATANTIALGNSVTGTISSYDDVDYYKLVPASNGKIELDFCHTYVDSGAAWSVCTYIYENGEYTQLSNWSVSLNGGEKEAIPYIGVVKNGVYYIKVARNYGSVEGENYTIQTRFTSSNYFEKEENDVYSSATDMEVNQSYNGILNSSLDKDYYKIVASQNGKIELSFCHTYVDSGAAWSVCTYIYENGEYTQLSNWSVSLNDGEKESIPYIGVAKNGVYYIKVARNYGSVEGENYTIQTKFTSSNYFERERNDVYASATDMNLNKAYNGTINSSADKDYYKIVAPETGMISLKFVHPYKDTSGGWNVSMYRYEDGQYIKLFGESIYLNSNITSSLPFIGVAKKGIYYVKVEKSYGTIEGENYTINGKFSANAPVSINASVNKNKVTLTWSKVNDVTGYEIYYRKGKQGIYKKLTSTVKTKYTYKKLKKGTMYYFKVRAYKVSGNSNFYSAYTNVKSVKYK